MYTRNEKVYHTKQGEEREVYTYFNTNNKNIHHIYDMIKNIYNFIQNKTHIIMHILYARFVIEYKRILQLSAYYGLSTISNFSLSSAWCVSFGSKHFSQKLGGLIFFFFFISLILFNLLI